jgi:proteasome accessory factor B
MSDVEAKASKADKSERLLQLTCALLFSQRGLTKQEIYSAIKSYSDALKQGISEESLGRMFERDKSDLRATGIQVETPLYPSDVDDQRYVIASDTFVWPKHASLNAKQLQLLGIAAGVWQQASLESEANQALVRLRALGIEPAEEDLIGFAPRIKTLEPSFTPLTEAIENSTLVSFNYRKPDGEVTLRKVEPWSLRNIDGQWLLQSFDITAREVRNFLLRRIVSKVQIVKVEDETVTFQKPSVDQLETAKAELEDFIQHQVAELKVRKDTSAWFHFHLDGAEPEATVSLQYMDLHLLSEELRDFALDIKVIRPKQLEEAIRAGFEKVVNDHA